GTELPVRGAPLPGCALGLPLATPKQVGHRWRSRWQGRQPAWRGLRPRRREGSPAWRSKRPVRRWTVRVRGRWLPPRRPRVEGWGRGPGGPRPPAKLLAGWSLEREAARLDAPPVEWPVAGRVLRWPRMAAAVSERRRRRRPAAK